MNIDEVIKGWTFEETVKTAENLMEAEKNLFKWDVIRHLRDFAETYREQLKEYQQLEEQGRFVKLPCMVGDTVYCIENKEMYTCTVGKISISKNNGIWVEINFPKEMPDIVAIEYNPDDIGKTVFLTKYEAEAKLKELKKELRGEENER